MEKPKLNILNKLALLENIDIKNAKSPECFHNINIDLDPFNYNNGHNDQDFNLKTRNLLKNEFFSKYIFDQYNNNNNNSNNNYNNYYKTQKIFKPKKISFPLKMKLSKKNQITLDIIGIHKKTTNKPKFLKKNNLTLNILNYKNNKIHNITKKFSHEDYRRKKYVQHLPYFCLNNANNNNSGNDSDNDIKKSIEINKYFNNFIYPKNKNKNQYTQYTQKNAPNYFLSIDNSDLSKQSTLYKMLHMKVHNLFTNRVGSKKILSPKMSNNSILSKTLYKKTVIDMIKSKNKPLFFISTYMKNIDYKKWKALSLCEKNRYKKIMEIFLDIKRQIKENPKQKFEIVKNFLIQNGIKEQKYLYIEKLNTLILYINGKLKVDATKTLKNNIIDILEDKHDKSDIIEENKI